MPKTPSSAGSRAVALTDRTDDRPVYVVGGGPGGLAAAAALRARGVRVVVLEKADRVGASW
ncbi:NAD(P)-binding protein, partial [Streptomyces californicus]